MHVESTPIGLTNGVVEVDEEVGGVVSRVDHIVHDLQRQIADGTLRSGQRLPSERSLGTAFGVGRTTVREALKSLLVQGYVERGRRGVTVADGSMVRRSEDSIAAVAARATVRDLYDVRKLLEVRIARWAALRATEADVEMLRAIVADEQKQRETSNGHHSHAAMHDALAEAAANPVLVEVYQTSRELFFRLPFIWQLLGPSEIHNARSRRHELAHHWHEQILRAIEQRDADEAEGAMFQHLDAMEKDLLTRLLVRPNHS